MEGLKVEEFKASWLLLKLGFEQCDSKHSCDYCLFVK